MKEITPSRDKRLSRRRLPKRHVRAYLRLGETGLGANLGLGLLDLSEIGACMTVKDELQPGREVTVGLEGQAHSRPIVFAGNVVWCKPTEWGAFTVGITFQKRLPYAEYVELTQEARSYTAGPSQDQAPTDAPPA